ncbi:MAG: protein kinase domain-containing protein [Akkermansiaceae bacterium]
MITAEPDVPRDQVFGLSVTVGRCSEAGIKTENEDCVGIEWAERESLMTKGIVSVVADGVSAASGGKVAAETCVKGFLADYFSTPDSWSIMTSVQRVLDGLNRWLCGQAHSEGLSDEKGYVSTFSALVLCSRTGYIFHIGDTRVYRVRGGQIEQLTRDHRSVMSKGVEYLSRAMGLHLNLQVDYKEVDLVEDDYFIICSDGLHDWLSDEVICSEVSQSTCLETTSQKLVQQALTAGSDDNLSCVLVRVDHLPEGGVGEIQRVLRDRPFPPLLSPGMTIDGLEIKEVLFESARSQLYRVCDLEDKSMMVMKTPSPHFIDDAGYIERFIAEEWIGKRVNHKNLVKVISRQRKATFLYYLMEEIEGVTLADWLLANEGKPVVEEVVEVVRQMVSGVRALHRKETLHQDLKLDNIFIDREGCVKVIDFGSCHIKGLAGTQNSHEGLATIDFAAPEYRLNASNIGVKSDLFSIAMIAYHLLSNGKCPYGGKWKTANSVRDFSILEYQSVCKYHPMVPVWLDGALKKALRISPESRYSVLSEFVKDLDTPNPEYLEARYLSLIEKDPVTFWKFVSLILLVILLFVIVLQ